MAWQQRHTPSGKVQWQCNQDGTQNAIISASQVSSSQLKEYLDTNYPGQYSVQLKRDKFRITVGSRVR
ncbi:hypothetical protein HER10_EVM0000541 [Colletotrichum scovillei]|uniref:Uncharacterized protein n=3 Tax=Colletotrichum acutatum species complex TaxID=2707335 RepID=A0A9P9X0K4_9PEZI|nr:uncharacterized protein HER10_EVM0000541 [Colletotrichum scovillei]XP_049135041.1 uncharacterized protein CLUP02_00030 [Colletotrichum lupini]XP_060392106.1 uncharacterized protein CABS01_15089 [Colletotrichum abscissum]KAK1463088.1 hypothetical protein CMEL01_13157 [Colletotrichum melonis]KAF4775770.1 hypothetical protein HER10_EVM0000541 [Colletotrichum scovillei]KAI3530009.1 hypothetical protein CABS02_14655 [Colletotrichum abscissum]KAK1477048.1 hypothetical protein CABS01_15089 [Colle